MRVNVSWGQKVRPHKESKSQAHTIFPTCLSKRDQERAMLEILKPGRSRIGDITTSALPLAAPQARPRPKQSCWGL